MGGGGCLGAVGGAEFGEDVADVQAGGLRSHEQNVTAYVQDQAGSAGARWLGPDAYQHFIDHNGPSSYIVPFPDGAGRLTVIGTGAPIQP